MQPKNVFVHDLERTLQDIETWTAEVRELLEYLPPHQMLATLTDQIQLPAVPDVDDMEAAEDDPGIVCHCYMNGVLSGGDITPTPPICAIQVKGDCFGGPSAASAVVRARHLYRALRGIELLAGVCRDVVGRMSDREQIVRPVPDEE